mgnify:CR=1 FL=1
MYKSKPLLSGDDSADEFVRECLKGDPTYGINFDRIQTNLIKLLEKLKFDVIPIKFSNSYYLKGGLHCCTLDTIRKN